MVQSNIEGVRMWNLPYPEGPIGWLWRWLKVHELLELSGDRRIAGVICYNGSAVMQLCLLHACRQRGIQLVSDMADVPHWTGRRQPAGALLAIDGAARILVARFATRRLICASSAIATKVDPGRKKSVVFPTCVDRQDPKWCQKATDYEFAETTFVFAGDPGRCAQKERLDWIVKAVVALNLAGIECSLGVAGPNTIRYRAMLRNAPSSLASRFSFHGTVSHRHTLALLRRGAFSLLIRPDTAVARCGFPTKLGESLACGTPVIATPVGDTPKYVKNGETGLLSRSISYHSVLEVLQAAATMGSGERARLRQLSSRSASLDFRSFIGSLAGTFVSPDRH
jgi:glycosyltransferase involved in cell wall biosynthesis